MDLVPLSEVKSRAERFQAWMRESAVDGVFVLQNADQFYFTGTVQVGLFFLPAAGEPLYLVQKSLRRARAESPWEAIVGMTSLKAAPEILQAEGHRRLRRVGLEMDVLPAAYHLRFCDLFPETEFVDASDAVRKVRMIKSPLEVDQMRQSAAMLERAFGELPNWMTPGITELELHSRLEGYLRLLGHQGITRMRGFNSEIAYGTVSGGESACYPTLFPGPVGFVGLYPGVPNGGSRRALKSGDPLMVDIVGGFGGYIADKTRTYSIREVTKELQDAHEFVLQLMGEIEPMLRPGTPCARIYRHCLDRVRESPYAENFMGVEDSRVRFVGHGVGLELDEFPVLASSFEIPLEAGMTIAVEPKMFFPGTGGVGIEDTYLITPAGCEKLTPSPAGIIQVS